MDGKSCFRLRGDLSEILVLTVEETHSSGRWPPLCLRPQISLRPPSRSRPRCGAKKSYPDGKPWEVPSDSLEFRRFFDLGIKYSVGETT